MLNIDGIKGINLDLIVDQRSDIAAYGSKLYFMVQNIETCLESDIRSLIWNELDVYYEGE